MLLYDGGALARRCNVVVISVHYRLGLLGFAALGDAAAGWGATANDGLLDIVEALRWIHGNVRAYGGDSANVTLFVSRQAWVRLGVCWQCLPRAGFFTKRSCRAVLGQQPMPRPSPGGLR